MDKSPRYKGMCRGAAEIQSRWNPLPGDFFFLSDDPEAAVRCHVTEGADALRIQNGFLIAATASGAVELKRVIWLPRLNQLMEMARELPYTFREITFQFYKWAKIPYGDKRVIPEKYFHSLEQVWLAFVIAQVYGHVWNGDDWTRVY